MKKSIFKYYKIFIVIGFLFYVVDKIYTEKCDLVFSTESSYIEGYNIVDKSSFKESFINYLYKNDNNEYLSKIYDYNTKEEMDIVDLIKMESIEEYNNKINELLYLKYPEYIDSELIKGYGENSYIFKDNELIIYFNKYNIDTDELLLLHVNYNEIYKYLNFTVLLDKDYKNESGFDYKSDKPTVAFTFDDSPTKDNTTRLIEILNKNFSRATFFMLGNKMESNQSIVKYVYESGNEVGSHTYTHKNLNKMSKDEIINDYIKVNNLYNSLTGDTIKLFRPPYGIIKNNMEDYLDVSYILWSVDTLDWKYRSKDYIVNTVLNNISDGDIILFHDTYKSSIDAVEELLPLLYKKGYQIVSVSELAKLKNKDISLHQSYRNFK